ALLSYIENETLAPSASGTSQQETTSPLLLAESKAEFVREMTGDIAAPFSTSVALFSMEEEYQRISDKIALGTATSQEQLQISELSKGIQEKRVEMNAADAKLEFDQEAQQALKETEPSYQDNILAINNNGQHEMKQALQELEYNNQVLEKLEIARRENAQSIQNGSTAEDVKMAADKDAALAAAIAEVKSNAENVQSIRAAYEVEIKSIIENDAVYREKLNSQLSTTQEFIVTLDEAIALKQQNLSNAQNAEDKKAILGDIDVLKNDKLQAQAKVAAYQNDILLLSSASDPVVTEVKTSSTNTNEQVETTSNLSVEELKAEAKAIQTLFKAKDESQSIFAYESGVFAELVAKFADDAHPIQNIEKIQEINDQIFLLEAEMENEKSKNALKKLDYKAEQLYFQRSELEIANAASIAYITQEAYVQESSISEQAIAENKEYIQSRMVLRDEIARLQTESERLMDEAAEIRFNAPSIQDEIEKADAYRTAFAKEALAIEQMRQIQQICRNAAPLSTYTEQDLVMLRTGTVPAHLLADAQRRDDASSLDVSLTNTADETELPVAITTEDSDSANATNTQATEATNLTSTEISTEMANSDGATNEAPIALEPVVLDEVTADPSDEA
ncbi:MAG: hypothetical protein ACKO66_04410, partial [Flavobacteriales bacterium]